MTNTEQQCVNCGETLRSEDPDHYKSHIPPIPDEFVTEQEFRTPEDVRAAFELASTYAFGEGAVFHLGGSQRKVTAVEGTAVNLDALWKVRPYSPYSGDCVDG